MNGLNPILPYFIFKPLFGRISLPLFVLGFMGIGRTDGRIKLIFMEQTRYSSQ